ncbi:hypothetical protein HYDPIDRAFT_77727 [Hydnomerulius pinastri MD-312]|nr:hypothetical protein HYDPIDRAFT_77727 [Hydnomerulius pinastri MD-312]
MAEVPPDGFERRLQERENMRHPLATIPTNIQPIGNIPNTPLSVSTISFLLGALFSLGASLFSSGGLASPWWATYQLGFFVAAWSGFHWGEFAVTAGWNLEKCSVDSFLLDNGAMYHVANGIALVEYLITLYFSPSLKAYPCISAIAGILLVFTGQALRTTAMVHASTNFSHAVAFHKRDSHQLVTNGVYAWFRHPSYAGFFYWALGTQMVLQNPISFAGFAVVLWRFFYRRTRAEERALVKFFGKDYEVYRQNVGTKIPFIP